MLTVKHLTVLWANSANNKLLIFSYFSWKIGIAISYAIVFLGDNLHEMPEPVFREQVGQGLLSL